MECLEAIKSRRSVRKFKDKPVEKQLIKELLDAAQMAPSAGNLQARDYVVVTNKTSKIKLASAALDQSFIEEAPYVIVAVANIERSSRIYRSRGEFYAIQDTTAGIMTLLLAAHSKGLGTCWVGAFDDNAVGEILRLPHGTRPVAIIPVGYSEEEPKAPQRLGFERIVHWETW